MTDERKSSHDLLDKILDESVFRVVGERVGPRPGQKDLSHDILDAMIGRPTNVVDENGDPVHMPGHVLGIAPTGVGKALWVETPIATTEGWKRMGDLIVGDRVFDERGLPCKVTGAYDVLHDRTCYRVVFDDGSTITADSEHLWWTMSKKGSRVITTREIAQSMDDQHTIPTTKPVSIGHPSEDQLESYRYLYEDEDGVVREMAGMVFSLAVRLGYKVKPVGTGVRILDKSDRKIVQVVPVESVPVRCIAVDSPRRLFLAGESFIPTHNTLAAIAPAFLVAVERGERTVLSTESLSLLSQIIDKDAPTFADAVEEVTGERPTFAILKGFSNYVCPLAAHSTAIEALEGMGHKVDDLSLDSVSKHQSEGAQKSIIRGVMRDVSDRLSESAPKGKKRTGGSAMSRLAGPSTVVQVGDREYDKDKVIHLLKWAVDEVTSGTGDRSTFKGDTKDGLWSTVSISPSECPGKANCPLGEVCLPRKAREDAAEADFIVTNHSILGVQANMGVPVIFGNKTLGDFDHLIVDEAHALPDVIRSGGGREVNAQRYLSVIKTFSRCVDTSDPKAKTIIDVGTSDAKKLDAHLYNYVKDHEEGEAVKFNKDHNPLEDHADIIDAWCKSALNFLPKPEKIADTRTQLKVKRCRSRIETFANDVSAGARVDEKSDEFSARWIEKVRPESWLEAQKITGATFNVSPVDVAASISANLMQVPMVAGEDEEKPPMDDNGEVKKKKISVSMISATIPPAFAREVGIKAKLTEYPSPFDEAYGASMLYVPRATDEEELKMIAFKSGNRWKFNTKAHSDWAVGYIEKLVVANEGHALVLSATKTAGVKYANHLRRVLPPNIRVFSQWDGRDSRQIVADWRSDPSSVMVGTRSLMTGVDAAGETCSLVIIDRIPRDAGNPVGDARVELLMKNQNLDKWSAERFVYGSDASLRLAQAAGRLIRGMSDAGMLAVLDPRLVPGTPLAYNKATSDMYLKALHRFKTRRSKIETAVSFLQFRAMARKAA